MILAIIFTVALVLGVATSFWRAAAFSRFGDADAHMAIGFSLGMLFAAICAWIGWLL